MCTWTLFHLLIFCQNNNPTNVRLCKQRSWLMKALIRAFEVTSKEGVTLSQLNHGTWKMFCLILATNTFTWHKDPVNSWKISCSWLVIYWLTNEQAKLRDIASGDGKQLQLVLIKLFTVEGTSCIWVSSSNTYGKHLLLHWAGT